jgi:hypothetical protein
MFDGIGHVKDEEAVEEQVDVQKMLYEDNKSDGSGRSV